MNTHALDLETSSSQYASITDASQTNLDITGDFTIEAWVKLEQLPSTLANEMVIASKDSAAPGNYGYRLELAQTDKPRIQYFDASDNVTTLTIEQTLSASTWTHIACAVDVSAANMTAYINNTSKSVTQTQSSATSVADNDEPFIIGARGNGAEYFDGLIDDVRVWSDIRTSTEIGNNWQRELIGTEAGLVGYWKLNNDYTDETSNNNDLTASNTPVFTTDVAFVDTGGIILFALT